MEPTTMPPRLLTIGQLSPVTGLSRATLYKLVMSGAIRSLKIGRRRLVPVEAVDEWIALQPDAIHRANT